MPQRALSFGNLQHYELINELHMKKAPDKPLHRAVPSLFTTSSGFTNFRGLINLGLFLLVVSSARAALENVLKYGIVMDPFLWFRFILQNPEKYYAIGLIICTNIFIVIELLIQLAASRKLISISGAFVLTVCNLFAVLAFPTRVILSVHFNPLFSSPVLTIYTIVFLKLWSYAAVNRWCLRQLLAGSKSPVTETLLNKLIDQSNYHRHASYDATAFTSFSEVESLLKSVKTSVSETNNHEDYIEKQCLNATGDTPEPDTSHSESGAEKFHNNGVGDVARTDQESGELRYRRSNKRSGCTPNLKRSRRSTDSKVGINVESSSWLDALEDQTTHILPLLKLYDIKLRQFVSYPQNLSISNLYYFIFAPTLCYELNFPRTPFLRKQFLIKRVLELMFLSQLILCLVQQWVLPTLQNSVITISQSNVSQFVERCLKLAIPNHLIWLLMFYAIFHSLLNILGELLYFGDRLFYSDWWNAESIPTFWSKWNIPVHRFARRHIYLPLINSGYSREKAALVVFFISALLHEFLVSLPLKLPRMWAFLGMIMQVPCAALLRYFYPHGGTVGNLAVWITLIIGQPLAILFYFHDYYVINYPN